MKRFFATLVWIAWVAGSSAQTGSHEPVTPNTMPEAEALLDLFYRVSGTYTFTGQHNYPNTRDRNSRFAARYAGQTPAVWSTDMGFAEDGDTDSYLARPDIVKEAIRQHRKGSQVTICWHAVPPTADEPVTFRPVGPVNPDSLASVQGQLPDEQFRELLTPGTRLYNRWAAQVDSVAFYLKQLEKAKVPVLWRPYHEMNGDWFWWGGRVGTNGTTDLYRQLYDRLVHHHQLKNLIWVWSVDRPSTPIRQFRNFYPGDDYLDILSLDVYGSDFNQDYYDSLMVLSNGKPLVLGEVGNPPSLEVMDHQPNWSYWVIWAGMVRNLTREQHQELVNDPRILSQEDPAYREVMNPYREDCGLPLLPMKEKYPVNFSGNWLFNEEQSELGERGPAGTPYRMEIIHEDDLLQVKSYDIVEWGDDRITHREILLDGTAMESTFFNSPRVSTARYDAENNSIEITTTTLFTRGEQQFEWNSREQWILESGGEILKIVNTSPGFRGGGEVTTTTIFEKEGTLHRFY
ncbi:MAG: glycoside hydrolase family 26 protein [Bacteroidales bacterium]